MYSLRPDLIDAEGGIRMHIIRRSVRQLITSRGSIPQQTCKLSIGIMCILRYTKMKKKVWI